MDTFRLIIKIASAVLLFVMLGGVAWAVTHIRKIKRTLIADEALPRPAPSRRILILIGAVLIGFSSLLLMIILRW